MTVELSKIRDLKRREESLRDRKGRLEGQLEAARSRFREVVDRIKEAGYDPKTIKQTLREKEEELRAAIDEYESGLEEAESALSKFEEVSS